MSVSKKEKRTKENKRPKKNNLQSTGPRPIITFIIVLFCIIIISIIFAAIRVMFLQDTLLGSESHIQQENGSINITFCRQESCEATMLHEINNANTISCAFYDLDLQKTASILAQKNANVLIYDEKAYNDSRAILPQAHHVPSRGLMHNKFCVLDEGTPNARIITGSMNPTQNDDLRNDNNLLIIRSASLAHRYTQEYQELASRKSISYTKNPSAPAFINLSGVMIEQRFCPQEACEAAIVREITSAQHEIEFMTFSFTSDPIGAALIKSHENGLTVSGVFEQRQLDQWSEFQKLKDAGIEVLLDGNKYTMHHKVFVIDNNTVITGSFNPTSNANTRNDENLLILHDQQIAMLYENEFGRVYSVARTNPKNN